MMWVAFLMPTCRRHPPIWRDVVSCAQLSAIPSAVLNQTANMRLVRAKRQPLSLRRLKTTAGICVAVREGWMASGLWVMGGIWPVGHGWHLARGTWVASGLWVMGGIWPVGHGWHLACGPWMASGLWVMDGIWPVGHG